MGKNAPKLCLLFLLLGTVLPLQGFPMDKERSSSQVSPSENVKKESRRSFQDSLSATRDTAVDPNVGMARGSDLSLVEAPMDVRVSDHDAGEDHSDLDLSIDGLIQERDCAISAVALWQEKQEALSSSEQEEAVEAASYWSHQEERYAAALDDASITEQEGEELQAVIIATHQAGVVAQEAAKRARNNIFGSFFSKKHKQKEAGAMASKQPSLRQEEVIASGRLLTEKEKTDLSKELCRRFEDKAFYKTHYHKVDALWGQLQKAWEERDHLQQSMETSRKQHQQARQFLDQERYLFEQQAPNLPKTNIGRFSRYTSTTADLLSFFDPPLFNPSAALKGLSKGVQAVNESWAKKDLKVAKRNEKEASKKAGKLERNFEERQHVAPHLAMEAEKGEEDARSLQYGLAVENAMRLKPPAVKDSLAWDLWARAVVQSAGINESWIPNIAAQGREEPVWANDLIVKAWSHRIKSSEADVKNLSASLAAESTVLKEKEARFLQARQEADEIQQELTQLQAKMSRAHEEQASQNEALRNTNQELNTLRKTTQTKAVGDAIEEKRKEIASIGIALKKACDLLDQITRDEAPEAARLEVLQQEKELVAAEHLRQYLNAEKNLIRHVDRAYLRRDADRNAWKKVLSPNDNTLAEAMVPATPLAAVVEEPPLVLPDSVKPSSLESALDDEEALNFNIPSSREVSEKEVPLLLFEQARAATPLFFQAFNDFINNQSVQHLTTLSRSATEIVQKIQKTSATSKEGEENVFRIRLVNEMSNVIKQALLVAKNISTSEGDKAAQTVAIATEQIAAIAKELIGTPWENDACWASEIAQEITEFTRKISSVYYKKRALQKKEVPLVLVPLGQQLQNRHRFPSSGASHNNEAQGDTFSNISSSDSFLNPQESSSHDATKEVTDLEKTVLSPLAKKERLSFQQRLLLAKKEVALETVSRLTQQQQDQLQEAGKLASADHACEQEQLQLAKEAKVLEQQKQETERTLQQKSPSAEPAEISSLQKDLEQITLLERANAQRQAATHKEAEVVAAKTDQLAERKATTEDLRDALEEQHVALESQERALEKSIHEIKHLLGMDEATQGVLPRDNEENQKTLALLLTEIKAFAEKKRKLTEREALLQQEMERLRQELQVQEESTIAQKKEAVACLEQLVEETRKELQEQQKRDAVGVIFSPENDPHLRAYIAAQEKIVRERKQVLQKREHDLERKKALHAAKKKFKAEHALLEQRKREIEEEERKLKEEGFEDDPEGYEVWQHYMDGLGTTGNFSPIRVAQSLREARGEEERIKPHGIAADFSSQKAWYATRIKEAEESAQAAFEKADKDYTSIECWQEAYDATQRVAFLYQEWELFLEQLPQYGEDPATILTEKEHTKSHHQFWKAQGDRTHIGKIEADAYRARHLINGADHDAVPLLCETAIAEAQKAITAWVPLIESLHQGILRVPPLLTELQHEWKKLLGEGHDQQAAWKAKISFHKAQKAESIAYAARAEARKAEEAPDVTVSERARLWEEAIQKAKETKAAWGLALFRYEEGLEAASLHREDVGSWWKSEVETAEDWRKTWSARITSWEAQKAESIAYAARAEARKAEEAPDVTVSERARFWEEAIQKAKEAEAAWTLALPRCEEGLEAVPVDREDVGSWWKREVETIENNKRACSAFVSSLEAEKAESIAYAARAEARKAEEAPDVTVSEQGRLWEEAIQKAKEVEAAWTLALPRYEEGLKTIPVDREDLRSWWERDVETAEDWRKTWSARITSWEAQKAESLANAARAEANKAEKAPDVSVSERARLWEEAIQKAKEVEAAWALALPHYEEGLGAVPADREDLRPWWKREIETIEDWKKAWSARITSWEEEKAESIAENSSKEGSTKSQDLLATREEASSAIMGGGAVVEDDKGSASQEAQDVPQEGISEATRKKLSAKERLLARMAKNKKQDHKEDKQEIP